MDQHECNNNLKYKKLKKKSLIKLCPSTPNKPINDFQDISIKAKK